MPSKLINADLEVLGKISATPGTASNEVVTKSQLDGKQDVLSSGSNIKTINGTTLLGSGNIVISGGTQNVFIQESEPTEITPFIWFKTNTLGKIIDIRQNI